MRNQIPLVPGQPAFDVTVHIVLNYFGLASIAPMPRPAKTRLTKTPLSRTF